MAGWPPGYPSRGAWLFRNVKEDFPFSPTLSSIEITQEYPDMVATLTCEVVWVGGQSFTVEDEVRVLFRGERIFAGHLKTVEETAASEFGPRIWRLEAQDFTAKLGDAIIRQREHRKAESALRRIRWILSYLPHAWHLDGRDLDVPDEQVEREDMYGMTVAEGLDSIANEMGLRYWVDLDNVLHVHKAQTIAAPFDLDNDAPDYSTSFPFSEFTYRRDAMDRANAILVEPEKRADSRWSVAQPNIAQYEWGDATGRKELFVSDEEIRTARAAERKGDTVLQRRKVPETEATLVCFEPGLWAGMSVSLTEAQWEHDQTMRIIRVDISAVDPEDDAGEAYLRAELTLNNKPKRRSPKIGRKEGEHTDVRRHAVDRFDRTATPPTPTPGAGFSVTIAQYSMEQQMVGSFADDVYTPGVPSTPTLTVVPSYGPQFAIDRIGWFNHPFVGTGCGIGLGAMDGWTTREFWCKVTIPAPPGGAEGFFLTVGWGSSSAVGAALTSPCYLHASLTEPAGLGHGTRIGTITPGVSNTLYVPAAFAPAGGGDVWLGFLPGWNPPHGWEPGWFCYYDPPAIVALNGSRDGFPLSGLVWATAGAPLDLGSAADSPEEAPWGEQSWDWQVAGTEGTYGIDGDALYATDGAVSTTLQGPGEDEDAAWGPWASPYAVELEFSVTGDIADAGERSIVVTTTSGTQTIGTISMGSASTDPSITVAGPSITDTADVDIDPDTRYRAIIDTRSGEVVGKVWAVADGEPADVDVVAAIDETDGEGDSFTLALRATNDGGEQTVRVHSVEMLAAASSGDRVDHEWLGFASGDTERFRNRQRYRPGTLVAHVNGIDAVPVWEDGLYFRLDAFPTAASGIHTSYTAE